ncbi:MAG: hypothetical protein AAFR59_18980, partial [Bacteroidota bacterium]
MKTFVSTFGVMLWLMASTCFSQISDDLIAIANCATNEIELEDLAAFDPDFPLLDCAKLDAKGVPFSPFDCSYIGYTPDSRDIMDVFYSLERENANGTFTTEAQNILPYFVATGQGAYRIRVHYPTAKASTACLISSPVVYIREKGKSEGIYGFGGEYGELSRVSNIVWVNPANQGDIQGALNNPNGNNFYSSTDDVLLSTDGTKNYKHNWLAIFENGGQNRYISRGWVEGTVEPILDVKAMWNYHYGSFLPAQQGVSYTVQYAISNPCNNVWANQNFTFFICDDPSGNCKAPSLDPNFTVFPNPANHQIAVRGATFYT